MFCDYLLNTSCLPSVTFATPTRCWSSGLWKDHFADNPLTSDVSRAVLEKTSQVA